MTKAQGNVAVCLSGFFGLIALLVLAGITGDALAAQYQSNVMGLLLTLGLIVFPMAMLVIGVVKGIQV